jgi:hypothetical protein
MENSNYKIAEFLAYNHEVLKTKPELVLAYSRALILNKEKAKEFILESLEYVLSQYFDPIEVRKAFKSDGVQIIIHKYFTKEWDYEH